MATIIMPLKNGPEIQSKPVDKTKPKKLTDLALAGITQLKINFINEKQSVGIK